MFSIGSFKTMIQLVLFEDKLYFPDEVALSYVMFAGGTRSIAVSFRHSTLLSYMLVKTVRGLLVFPNSAIVEGDCVLGEKFSLEGPEIDKVKLHSFCDRVSE